MKLSNKIEYIFFVESPTKIKIFNSIFGNKCITYYTKGHIKQLSNVNMGFNYNNFEEDYVILSHVAKLEWFKNKDLLIKNNKKIIIATDNDREGELIAYHLNLFFNINLDVKNRMIFNELTEKVILKAINNLSTINMNLVASQQSRRIIDRYIGFSFSPLLTKILCPSQSAGRVQTIVLQTVSNKYQAFIDAKNKYFYFIKVSLNFENYNLDILSDKKFLNEEECNKFLKENKFYIEDLVIKNVKISAPKSFITSTLQRFLFSFFSLKPDYVMRILQFLYEGDFSKLNIKGGLITYPRTDSHRFSKDFYDEVYDYINLKYGSGYFKQVSTNKKNIFVQDAHECIRPTNLNNIPEKIKNFFVDTNAYKVYLCIYYRSIAMMMSDALLKKAKILIKSNNLSFTKEIFFFDDNCSDGFLLCPNILIHNLSIFKKNFMLIKKLYKGLEFKEFIINKYKTVNKSLTLFNQSSIIKWLSDKKIGRPSTYSIFIPKLKTRKYLIEEKKKLIPTKLGKTVLFLLSYFSSRNLLNDNLTYLIEQELDRIEHNKLTKKAFLSNNINIFSKDIDYFKKFVNFFSKFYFKIKKECNKCKNEFLYLTNGWFGLYYRCTNCSASFSTTFEDLFKNIDIIDNIIIFKNNK